MDGTLTVAVHDFQEIRTAIGLASDEPILEALEKMPRREAQAALDRLNEIEMEIARDAQAGEGVEALLRELVGRKARLGILTRNGVEIAHETLRACGLLQYFDPQFILGREQAPPKPKPDGIHKLLDMWEVQAYRAVMVGDYYYDLAAGRAAGTSTVYVDPRGESKWCDYADITVTRLDSLVEILEG